MSTLLHLLRWMALAAALALLAGAIVVASETQTYKVGQLVIETPWTWATSAWAHVVGGYLKITNTGADADRLIGGTLPVAATAEVHEMAMHDGIMRMRRLPEGLEIKPGQTVELKPSGNQIRLTGLH